ncbi:MAG TPA: HEPN domain-containing protein [Bacteroidetes bacterium]|nr:HEPN domain-containing protein [Bacteroidota bacterium]
MNDETKIWLEYAIENLQSAEVLLNSELYNPCLQNVQQSVEKTLKSILIENSIGLKKTHSINELKNNGITVDISDGECDFLDSIYLPSKYPIGSVLPYFEPICSQSVAIAKRVLKIVQTILK